MHGDWIPDQGLDPYDQDDFDPEDIEHGFHIEEPLEEEDEWAP